MPDVLRQWRTTLVFGLVFLAGCGQSGLSASVPASTPATLPALAVPSQSSGAPSASSAPAVSIGTPEAVIDAFLAFARTPEASFSVRIEGDFKVGTHSISYALTGRRSGKDVIQEGIERIDGAEWSYGTAFAQGRLLSLSDNGWVPTDATPDQVHLFGSSLLSFGRALVLEDLGADGASGGYRLRVSAGFSLWPPQMDASMITDAHDATEHLEITLSAAGLPLVATYTRSISGTIDGQPGIASGSVTFTFSDIGLNHAITLPDLAPDATLPPAVEPMSAPAMPLWTSFTLEGAPYRLEIPGTPAVTSTTIENANLGPLKQTASRLTLPSGAKYTALELSLPATYIRDQGAVTVAREAISLEATNLGATVIGQREVTDGVATGVEALLGTKDAVYRVRCYVFDDDTVEIGVAGSLDDVASAEADRFLFSLVAAP